MLALKLSMDDEDAAVRTVYGEARGEPFEGQIAVAFVIRNRATWDEALRPLNPEHEWWGKTVATVCHHPNQFSCWRPSDPNSTAISKLSDTTLLYTALLNGVVRPVMAAAIADPTNGATHYKVRGTKAEWDISTKDMQPVSIGAHDFYRLGPNA